MKDVKLRDIFDKIYKRKKGIYLMCHQIINETLLWFIINQELKSKLQENYLQIIIWNEFIS